jgi:hypothetical protein
VPLHRAIATALEEVQGADTQSHLSLPAHHWRELAQSPEEVDKAIDYSIRAGDSAAKALAIGEAPSLWDDALSHQPSSEGRASIRFINASGIFGLFPKKGGASSTRLSDARFR